MGPCAQAGPGSAGGQVGRQRLGTKWHGDDLPSQWGGHLNQQMPHRGVWQEGEGGLGKGEELGCGAAQSVSGLGAPLGTCAPLGSVPTQGLGEEDGAGSRQQGQLRRAACQKAMQKPHIPCSWCAGTSISTWVSSLLPACPACPQVTSEQAGGAREANPLVRGSPGHGAALLAGYTCFCLALTMFTHPGPLLSARG